MPPRDDAIIGVAFKWSIIVLVAIGLVVGIVLLANRSNEAPPKVVDAEIDPPEVLASNVPEQPDVVFTEITSGAGIGHVHENAARGQKLLPETMGSGVAVFDADADGDQDLLFVNARAWAGDDGSPVAGVELYHNDGTGQFARADDPALAAPIFGLGAACGDVDNDGRVDLFIAALGANRLLRNTEAGFVDVTESAGVAGAEDDWSSSAGFFDADNDGDLDLFVCNYVRWSRDKDLQLAFSLNGRDRAYGPPIQYEGAACAFYLNQGDGTFVDATEGAGIAVRNPATNGLMAKALALTFSDLDRDGDLDVLVANDTVQNFLFRNEGDGTFVEVGAMSGVAFDMNGEATGAMGIDIGDFANSGRLAIGIGNFANESTSFYVQQPRSPWQFADMAAAEGIGSPSKLALSFGLFFFDYDLDGRLDLLQANGHLEDEINEIQSSQHYRQPAQLFWNCGPDARSCYVAIEGDQLGDLSMPIVGRGAAFGDLDEDGDLDVVLTQAGERSVVLRNDQALGHHWLRVRLVGTRSNRDGIGAEVELTAGGVTQRRAVMPTRSYLSQVELPVTFGLGDQATVESLRVRWPSGAEQSVAVPGVDRLLVITEPE